MFQKNSTILFQGDSITDCSRNREDAQSCGIGYVNLLKSQIQHDRPADGIIIYNKGISGNRVVDLYARWKEDCFNLAPDIVSILIGVNDIWHEYKRGTGVEADKYRFVYNQLLLETKERMRNVRLILLEPFFLRAGDVALSKDPWEQDMGLRQAIVKNLAETHGATFVPLQAAFSDAAKKAPAEHWLRDGVHPTAAGHWLIAKTWLEYVL